MKFVLFYHSLVSDWNHGNAHFLRGVVSELISRGHTVVVYESRDGWSLQNLLREQGQRALDEFHNVYPRLKTNFYNLQTLDLDKALADADVVFVHEWNDHALVMNIGLHRARKGGYKLLFHDTHHRSVTAPEQMAAYDLRHYDGVLAFGQVITDLYVEKGWAASAWTWHEAADARVFHPHHEDGKEGELVWVGNWGDEERTRELQEFLIDPCAVLGLDARIHGVRYPMAAHHALKRARIDYRGWLPNFAVPRAFSRFSVTVHVPRRPYVEVLPGIPTIRPFEAMACGIPLISAPWDDAEELFTEGRDYIIARNGHEMRELIRAVLEEEELASQLIRHARRTILSRHTCAHRVDQLMGILRQAGIQPQDIAASA